MLLQQHARAFTAQRPARATRSLAVQASAQGTGQAVPGPAATDRRSLLLAAPAAAAAALALQSAAPAPALAGQAAAVSTYLPATDQEGLYLFVPDKKKTPAIRAGTVDPSNPYRFALPGTWREAQVANIQSGNYCQPRCAEPWTEVIFEQPKEGKLQVIVAPLVRLTNVKGAKIEDIGTPEGILTSLGAFITGTQPPEPEDVVYSRIEERDGLKYYNYEVYAPYGTNGPHTLSTCTTKGDLALLFIVAANDKQWAANEGMLRKVVASFRA